MEIQRSRVLQEKWQQYPIQALFRRESQQWILRIYHPWQGYLYVKMNECEDEWIRISFLDAIKHSNQKTSFVPIPCSPSNLLIIIWLPMWVVYRETMSWSGQHEYLGLLAVSHYKLVNWPSPMYMCLRSVFQLANQH